MKARIQGERRWVNTEEAELVINETSSWNGSNFISDATGREFDHQTLVKDVGEYFLVHHSQWQGSTPWAERISREEAVQWARGAANKIKKEANEI